jgi:hypothetical protein
MSFFIYADKFDPQHVHFAAAQCEHPHPHSINSNFSRITYSTNHISLNNVGFVLSDTPVAKLCQVERAILDKFVLHLGETRRQVYAIAQTADMSDDTLTIFGVWETPDECGIVYKISKQQ